MAQSVLKLVKGTGPDDITITTNATNISTDTAWFIFATGVTREEAWKMLEDAQLRIAAENDTTFPT